MDEFQLVRFMVLCKGRHPVPAEFSDAVFPFEIEHPFDFDELYSIADAAIKPCSNLSLIVTGMTPCLIAVIKVCMDKHIDLRLLHYNRDSGEYEAQYLQTYIPE